MKSKKTKVSKNHKAKLKEIRAKKIIRNKIDTISPSKQDINKTLQYHELKKIDPPPISCFYRLFKNSEPLYFQAKASLEGSSEKCVSSNFITETTIDEFKKIKKIDLDNSLLCDFCQETKCLLLHNLP